MQRFASVVVVLLVICLSAAAQTTTGTWGSFGDAVQTSTYNTFIQPPINSDGTSTFARRGTIPVKFTLAVSKGDMTIDSSGPNAHAYGGVYFTPSATFTLNDLTTLLFTGSMNIGSCGGGSPRFVISYGTNQNVFVYLGNYPNFDGALCGNYGAGYNVMSATDARFDTSQLQPGTQYNTLANAKASFGTLPIQEIDLVVDGFWTGAAQVLTLHTVQVNDNIWTLPTSPTPTCTLPAATIDVQKLTNTTYGSIDESIFNAPADDGNNFRIDSCQYVYNLNAKNIGAGMFKVFANIGGVDVQEAPGTF